ncbi:MAG: hypothetical protein AAFR87_28245 [Bacteroidota bacterium]
MEKIRNLKNNGFLHLFIALALIFSPTLVVLDLPKGVIAFTFLLSLVGLIWLIGLFTVQPNQTRVLLFFGKYKGTVKDNGFFWVNPFYSKKSNTRV